MRNFIKLLCTTLIIGSAYATENIILVGTTGDYPPLTYTVESSYSGTDIKIIQDFAAANKLTIKFVQTSWPTLSSDLTSNKFVLAVGGISNNPERSKLFYLSDAIESSAKVGLIRCSDSNRFNNFAAIDTTNVTVIENRGGTNQDFAIKNIKHATIVLTPQNSVAISKLTDKMNPADIMFTDDIEVKYRHQINAELCQAQIPEQFPSADKVFIFSKTQDGAHLYKLFNQWWRLHKTAYSGN